MTRGLAHWIKLLLSIAVGSAILLRLVVLYPHAGLEPFRDWVIVTLIFLELVIAVGVLGLGWASYSLVWLAAPLVSLALFAASGEVAPWFNQHTQLINVWFGPLMQGLGTCFVAYVWLLVALRMSRKRLDIAYLRLAHEVRNASSPSVTNFFAAVALVATIIFLPSVPSARYNSSPESLLPGNAWNALALVAYFFVFFGRRTLLQRFTVIAVPAWMLLHFLRVEVLGLALIALLTATRHYRSILSARALNVAMLAIFTLFGFAYIGTVRNTGFKISADSAAQAAHSIANYPTVQDVLYSTAAAIDYADNVNRVPTLLWYGPRLVPFAESFPDVDDFIRRRYVTNNGLIFIGEVYLNFGPLGFLGAPFLLLLLFILPLRVTSLFGVHGKLMGYYLLVTLTARVFWYGPIYLLKPAIVIAPVLLLLFHGLRSLEGALARRKDLPVQPVAKVQR